MTKVLLLPALALALASAPALAEDTTTRTVQIDRAQLTTEAGANAAYQAITRTALEACRDENRGGAAFERSVRICTNEAVTRTVASLDAPLLTAHHNREPVRIRLASATRTSAF